MFIKRLLYIFLLYGGLLILFTACHTDYLHLNYEASYGCYSDAKETEIAFVLSTSAYRAAKGISKLPDGGSPKYLLRSMGLFILDTNNNHLTNLVSFNDLIYRNFNIPTSIKTKITVVDSCIYYHITPITKWDTYLKWCKNSVDSSHIYSLKEKYQKHYKVRRHDKQIFLVDSMEFIAAFLKKNPYSLTKLNKILDDVPLNKMGLQIMNIYPKSQEKYIEETIYLKNESALSRRAVVEQIVSKLSKDEIKLLLKKMDIYNNSLDGYEKTKYEEYSKETYKQIQALL